MLGLKKYFVMGAVILTLIGGFYWYYKDSQARMSALVETNTKLGIAVKINQETISTLQKDYAAANTELRKINTEFRSIREQNLELSNKLAEHDLGMLASKKPTLVEGIVNNASNNAGRCFELLSGADLTEKERNAKDARSFNSECPWIYNSITSP